MSSIPPNQPTVRSPSEDAVDPDTEGGDSILQVLHAALDCVSEPCLIIDALSRILVANIAAKNLLQKRGRLIGRKLDGILADNQLTKLAGEAGRAHQTVTSQIVMHLPDEGWRQDRRFTAVLTPIPGARGLIRLALRADNSVQAVPPPPESLMVRLRNPLAILQGYIETLLDGIIKDPVLLRQSLMTMRRQTEQIERLLQSARES